MKILSYEPAHEGVSVEAFWVNNEFYEEFDQSFLEPFADYDKSYLIEILRYEE